MPNRTEQFSAPEGADQSTPVNPNLVAITERRWQQTEDFWAVLIAGLILLFAFLVVWQNFPDAEFQKIATDSQALSDFKYVSPLKGWFDKPGSWSGADSAYIGNPLESFQSSAAAGRWPGIITVLVLSSLLFSAGVWGMGGTPIRFLIGYLPIFMLALMAYVLASHQVVKLYNLEYALWALGIGLMISHTIGTPRFVTPGLRTEFFIKTGLVLLGAEVLLSRLLELGLPGVFIAWVVTPIVLISTFWFGQKILKIESPSLNMVISADMSVCGVSAAIATAAACRAKKEELSFAIGLSLTFTVIMMVIMPAAIRFLGINPVLGGAWLGGTIDSTGAVAVAGSMLGDVGLEVAATIKMIQNILIGFTAFGVAVYWVSKVERDANSDIKPSVAEIWKRFPKFVIGFVSASVVFSLIYYFHPSGEWLVDAMKNDCTKTLRGWFFCLAFVSIGLETNFFELTRYLSGGKPLLLYVCGQTFNILLTFTMAWLMFHVFFPDLTAALLSKGG